MRSVMCLLIGFLVIPWTTTAHAADAYKFVSEYVRGLGAVEKIRADGEQELKADRQHIFADCIRNSTKFQLELRSSVAMLRKITLKAPVDDLIPNVIQFYEQKIELYGQLSGACAELLVGPQPNVDYGKVAAEAPKINALLEYIDQSLFKANLTLRKHELLAAATPKA
jgi:hypothetical protein